jgi:hypothetical protein
MESEMNSFVDDEKYKQDDQDLELEQEVGGGHEHDHQEENSEILKTRISNHPLYELLVEAHLDCLKVPYLPLSLSLQFIEFIFNSLASN